MKIRKAIIPVAGLGTRFLPASKAQPKEMLTLVDKPVIQYIVEELVEAGIKEIIFVTSQSKRAIEDHFDTNFELEVRLAQKKKTKALREIQKISKLAKFAFVRQDAPKGDGHAVLAALPFVNSDEPVAISFGDDVFHADRPVMGQLIDVYEKYHDPVIALCDVGPENVASYGIASGNFISSKIMELQGFVEKPAVDKAPTSLAAVGRYIITPGIMKILATQKPGVGGEVRLSDAFVTHLRNESPIYGRVIDGTRYDCGNKLRFLEAVMDFGLRHEVNAGDKFSEIVLRKAAQIKKAARKRTK